MDSSCLLLFGLYDEEGAPPLGDLSYIDKLLFEALSLLVSYLCKISNLFSVESSR